jgi:hypothetical protein
VEFLFTVENVDIHATVRLKKTPIRKPIRKSGF